MMSWTAPDQRWEVPRHHMHNVIIIGGGLAGLSAAIYLGRSRRDTLLIHSGRSMAKWERDAQNYLGFPDGIDGNDLLARGFAQARCFNAEVVEDEVNALKHNREGWFEVASTAQLYLAQRVLLATGLTHLLPDIPGAKNCLGKSLFFCKDCDAYRVQGRSIVIIGTNNEATEYALSMLLFSSNVLICANGSPSRWDTAHAGWLGEYSVPVIQEHIGSILHDRGQLSAVVLESGESLGTSRVYDSRLCLSSRPGGASGCSIGQRRSDCRR